MLVDPQLTCFEPDTVGNMMRGLEYHRFFFDAGTQTIFLANVLRYVRYMLSAVRLSVVCLLSVTLVHPTQAVELFGNFFSPYDSPGTLLFWCQKSLVGTPLSP